MKYPIVNKEYYGIDATSCDYDINLPQYLRITDITNDGSNPARLPSSIDTNNYPD